jgi:hypothetical protein
VWRNNFTLVRRRETGAVRFELTITGLTNRGPGPLNDTPKKVRGGRSWHPLREYTGSRHAVVGFQVQLSCKVRSSFSSAGFHRTHALTVKRSYALPTELHGRMEAATGIEPVLYDIGLYKLRSDARTEYYVGR